MAIGAPIEVPLDDGVVLIAKTFTLASTNNTGVFTFSYQVKGE
jgi:hypothetical protein